MIRIGYTLIGPFLPYIYLTFLALLLLSGTVYYLTRYFPSHVYGLISRLVFLPGTATDYIDLLEYPARTAATPVCALTGLLCQASFISQHANSSKAGGFWNWNWMSLGADKVEVDIGEVARSLTKEVMGAKDIFESITMLSEGRMTDQLGYVK
jgi:hypothetical protein